jgi:TusA-related sulfurtransferase
MPFAGEYFRRTPLETVIGQRQPKGADVIKTGAERVLEAITARDFSAFEDVLAPASRLRALLPNGLVEDTGPADIADRFTQWFGSLETFEILEARTQVTGDRSSLQYRFRTRWPGEDETVISQHVVLFGTNGTVDAMHLVCSGFRPAQESSAGALHDYDAGTLGCGDGLAEAFKQQIKEVGVGDLLAVHTVDPSAKEDLPSLARLMGHKVHSVEAHPDGGLTITVERGK